MEIVQLNAERLEEAARLALRELADEREALRCEPAPPLGAPPALPPAPPAALLRDELAELLDGPCALAALEGGALAGYLAFEGPFDGYCGNVAGAFAPLHGCAVAGPRRARVLEALLAAASARLVEAGVCCCSVARFAHDAASRDVLTMSGYGIRCADAIRPLAGEGVGEGVAEGAGDAGFPAGYTPRLLGCREAGALLPLKNGLIAHLRQAPVFLPVRPLDAEAFARESERRGSRYLVAYEGEEPVAYIELGTDGENYLTGLAGVRNICGAYALERARHTGAAGALADWAARLCRAEGAAFLGVDCETLNLAALHFWGKRFTRYTLSYNRRFDERARQSN